MWKSVILEVDCISTAFASGCKNSKAECRNQTSGKSKGSYGQKEAKSSGKGEEPIAVEKSGERSNGEDKHIHLLRRTILETAGGGSYRGKDGISREETKKNKESG